MREDVPALTGEGPGAAGEDLDTSRRRLLVDGTGIAVSALGFGFVYGLSAREVGFSPIEAIAMSVIVFGGAAQFAAVGYVASGLPWPGIVLLTALLNARHLLYSASLGPWFRGVPFARRAIAAHLLTDEAFALSIGHFRRLGRFDEWGYWIGAIVATFIPWNIATLAGVVLGGEIPDPSQFGIDIIFPAAMIGLAVGLITGRRELVAAFVGAGVGVVVALMTSPAIGIIVGGLVGPAVGTARPGGAGARDGATRHTFVGRPVPHARAHVQQPPDPRSRCRRSGPMSTDLVPLAVLMFLVTYPTRAVGLLTPGMERLPRRALDYLQLVGPAVLAALAAVAVMVVVDESDAADLPRRHRVGRGPRLPRGDRVAAEPAPRAHRRRRDRRAGASAGLSPRCRSDAPAVSRGGASASISTEQARVASGAATTTIVAAGRIVAEDLAVDRRHARQTWPCRSRTSASGRRR